MNLLTKFPLILLVLLSSASLSNADQPNLVFIIADDCTFRDIGCYGGQAHTPNIDKLATEGMKFERCFQAAPMCSPTRHNIYTGLYPVKSGAYPNHTRTYDHVKSIVHFLRPMGYRVALTGKTHISPASVFPFERLVRAGKSPSMEEIDSLFADSTKSNKPFCLFACSNEPHSPWDKGDASRYPPAEVKLPSYIVDTETVREDFSNYLAEITFFDDEVGQIVGMLEKHGLADNTLLMVVSEQGNGFPFAKWTCYDNGLQSAMLARWPGKIKPGSMANAMVEYVDITPTFVDAAGGKPIAGLDGRSFLPVLRGETDEHKDYVYGMMTTRGIINGSDAFAIRSVRGQRFKLIKNLNHETKFTNACTAAPAFKSMEQKAAAGDANARRLVDAYYYRPPMELYDMQSDPFEQNNLADSPDMQNTVSRLSGKLTEWMESQGDKGIETELKAFDRQVKQRKNKKSRQNKK